MKELSIEEKAKAYDKALEKMKEIITMDNNPTIPKEIGEYLFPELKESEDERIRRQTLKVLNYYKDDEKAEGRMPIEIDECIAWLEKQGEQKASYTTIVETGNGGINALVTRELLTNGCDEQKPAWSEEDEKMLNSIIDDFYDGKTSNMLQESWLKSLKQRIGGKP